MDSFREGYVFFEKNSTSYISASAGAEYIESVNCEIEKLVNDLNQFEGFKTSAKQLKGDIAEFWHADTFNIQAVLKDSKDRATVDRSHDYASADITTNYGKSYGLKYYSTAEESAKAQATSVFQKYNEYRSHGGKSTLEEYLSERGYSDESVLNDPIYAGQVRIIPKDQLKDAIEWLNRKIEKESATRPEQVYRYRETLKMLRDKLDNGNGIESIPLSRKEAQALANLAKQGGISADDLGLTTEELIQYEYVLHQAVKAGLSAATISIALKIAPEIINTIQYLIQNGEIDANQLKKIGFAALSGSAEGFIRGSVSAALTTTCAAGMLGEALKNISPSVIGAVTVLTMNTIANSFQVAAGKKHALQLGDELARDMYVSAWSLLGGGIGQSFIATPVLGYLIGSFVGSVIGSFTYKAGQNAILSFCTDTGFTMFGLVDQDYTLPKGILEEIGLKTLELDTIKLDTFEPEVVEFDTFTLDCFEPERINLTILRRGVIGVAKIGYLS